MVQNPIILLSSVLVASSLAGGCVTSRTLQKHSERVAKDWCVVIRASQVIPIYPLSEDLVPGDIFLVQQTREEQVRQYHEAGFLPLDHHFARLRPNNYADFYLRAHGTGDGQRLPYTWLFPEPPGSSNILATMPLAAFPTYSFEITRSGGLNLALPIQGVPVALNFLNAGKAQGNVVLREAATYGVDESSLAETVYGWAARNQAQLADFAPFNGRTNYLRVVNRVYLLRSVSVSLTQASAAGVAASGGADKDVNLIRLQSTNAGANYATTLSNLNASVAAAALPGGSLKFTGVSRRGVSLEEEFPRPLVVGYIGYDIPILPEGKLGAYTSTLRTLSGKPPIISNRPVSWSPDPNTDRIRDWLKASPDHRGKLVEWLAAQQYPYGKVTTYFESGAEFRPWRAKFIESTLNPQP